MTVVRDKAWIGIDVGKTHHWACVVDTDGRTMLSVKLVNDETDIVAFLQRTGTLASNWSGRSTSSGPRQRCSSVCWLGPATLCAMHRVEWWRR